MQFGAQECVRHWGKFRPDTIAIQTEGGALSYRELDNLVEFIAQRIRKETDAGRIGILARSKVACLAGLLAANRADRSGVTFHLGIASNILSECLSDTQPRMLIADATGYAALAAVGSKLPVLLWDASQRATTRDPEEIENRPEQECCVLYSSGTTGRSKGIERDHYSMVTESIGWCLELGLSRQTKFYVGRPIFYTGGLVISLATLTVGGSLIYVDGIDDNQQDLAWASLVDISNRYRPDWAFFIPDQLRFFTARAREEHLSIEFPRQILTMGAPITGKEKTALSEALKCKVVESWGNSESLGTITDLEDLAGRPDSIGRPFLTDELFIVDEKGKKLGPNQIGRIAGHREAGFTRYTQRDEATRATIVGDMIISDDIGKIDESGRFYVLGRVSDLISINGQLLTTSMIERAVRTEHPQLPFVIVPLTKDQRNPGLGIVTERASSESVAAIESLILREYGNAFRLSHVGVDALPRLPTGKFDRVRLVELLTRARGHE